MEIRQNQSDVKKRQNILKWSGLGVEFCGVTALFSYFGYKLDARFDTRPWFLLGGFFVGFVGMMYLIIKDAWKFWRD